MGRVEGLKTALAAREASATAAAAAADEAEARRAALAAQLEAAQAAANAAECRANDASALAAEWKEQAVVLRRQLTPTGQGQESPRERTPHPHPRAKQAAEQGAWGSGSPSKVLGPQTAALLADSQSGDLIPAARVEAVPAPADAQHHGKQQPAAQAAAQAVVLRINVVEPPPEAQQQLQHQLEGQVAALQQRCAQLASEAAALHQAAAAAAAQHAEHLQGLESEHQSALAELAASHAADLERQAEQQEQELCLLQQQHMAAVGDAAAADAAEEQLAGGSGAPRDRTPSPLQRRFQQKLRQVGGCRRGFGGWGRQRCLQGCHCWAQRMPALPAAHFLHPPAHPPAPRRSRSGTRRSC